MRTTVRFMRLKRLNLSCRIPPQLLLIKPYIVYGFTRSVYANTEYASAGHALHKHNHIAASIWQWHHAVMSTKTEPWY